MSKHISKLQKPSNTRISLHATHSASKRVSLKERHYVCYERTQLKRNLGVPKLKEILMKNWSLITNKLTQTLQESFRIVAYSIVMLTGRTSCSKTFWSELRSLPTLKNASKLWFIATYRHFLSVAS